MKTKVTESQSTELDFAVVRKILTRRGKAQSACVQILQDLQQEFGYLPGPALEYVINNSEISAKQLYGVATFYGQFRFSAAGRYLIRVCHGTACHVNGSEKISSLISKELGIRDQETTADGLFTLESVACLGCCSLAPVMMINDTVYGRLTANKIREILDNYRQLAMADTSKKNSENR